MQKSDIVGLDSFAFAIGPGMRKLAIPVGFAFVVIPTHSIFYAF